MIDRDMIVEELEIVKRRVASLDGFSEEAEVIADAIALIKSLKHIAPQTPEPRLLELDEIKMRGLMWLESRDGFVQPVICQNYEYGVDRYVDFIMVHGTICNSINTFGKLWRVWTSEPSKEQREAMRWWNE